MLGRWWWKVAAALALAAAVRGYTKNHGGWDKEAAVKLLSEWSERLGIWAIPLYVLIHTLSIALCLPSAVFLEAAASLLFGFFPAVLCVFSAKLLAASLSFWIGRYFCSIQIESDCDVIDCYCDSCSVHSYRINPTYRMKRVLNDSCTMCMITMVQ